MLSQIVTIIINFVFLLSFLLSPVLTRNSYSFDYRLLNLVTFWHLLMILIIFPYLLAYFIFIFIAFCFMLELIHIYFWPIIIIFRFCCFLFSFRRIFIIIASNLVIISYFHLFDEYIITLYGLILHWNCLFLFYSTFMNV